MSIVAGTPKTYKNYKPADWLRGSTNIGGNYTAYDTYGQGKPDFGKGAGPGMPYHEVQKKVSSPPVKLPNWAGNSDPRITAIRRRLGWA